MDPALAPDIQAVLALLASAVEMGKEDTDSSGWDSGTTVLTFLRSGNGDAYASIESLLGSGVWL